jgi:hypothetical protein
MICRDEFLEGAARAFFVMAYADFVENEDTDLPGASMGADWMDVAPERTPPNAYAFAGELWARLAILNKETAPCGVVSLLNQAAEADGVEEVDAEDFGHYCAMAALGSGVSWFDDHADFPLEVPYMDCGTVDFDPAAYREED